MIDDLPLRWMVTGLFLLSGAGFAIVIDRRSLTSVLGHGLHVVMAIAMAVMAWPQGLRLPATVPGVLFGAAALWFVMTAVLTARVLAQRVVRGYNALTMFAMAWMYAVGHDHPLPIQASPHHHHQHHHTPDMDMTATDVHTGDTWPGWLDAVNWVWTLIFVVAAVVWGYRFVSQRGVGRRRRARSARGSIGRAVQAMMATGMAIMFGALVFGG